MKYVWILVTIIILVRIDMVLNFIDKSLRKLSSSQETEMRTGEIPVASDLVPMNSDLTLKVAPRDQFLTILNDFYVSPGNEGIEKALEVLKNNPKIFSEKLDIELEVKIYRLRELIQQKNKLSYDFIYSLMKVLKGENLEMVKRFSSLLIDYDLPEFLNRTPLTGDVSCLLSLYLADNLPEEEKYNELSERTTLFQNFINSSTPTPAQKLYAENCLNLLRFQVEKMRPQFEPPLEDNENRSITIPPSEPVSTDSIAPTGTSP